MRYFCLPRNIVESIQNFPPAKDIYRPVNFILKDGSIRNDGEFYAMDETKHKYFEPADISFASES
jgi:hypothetical protein